MFQQKKYLARYLADLTRTTTQQQGQGGQTFSESFNVKLHTTHPQPTTDLKRDFVPLKEVFVHWEQCDGAK